MDVQTIYQRRFADMLAFRRRMWDVLCREFFQRDVRTDATVVEIGAGYCEFINQIHAGRKIAVDLNPDTRVHAAADVTVITSSTAHVEALADGTADIVFASNFLEHLSCEDILAALREVHRLLKLYLKLRAAWRLFGQQSFFIATPRG